MTIPVILSSGSLYTFDLDTVMTFARDAGFDGLELMVDFRRETHNLAHLRKLINRNRMPVMAVHSPFQRMKLQGWPTDPVAVIKKSVELAETLGAQTVVVHPPPRWFRLQGTVSGPQWSRKTTLPLPFASTGELGRWLLEDLPAFQESVAVKIAVENMPVRKVGPLMLDSYHYPTPQQLRQFQYLTLDTTHVGTRHTDLLAFYRQIADKVAHVHLSNYNGHEHQRLDDGVLPLAEFLRTLEADGYDGLVSVELGTHSLEASDDDKVRQHLQDTVAFCRAALTTEA